MAIMEMGTAMLITLWPAECAMTGSSVGGVGVTEMGFAVILQ